MIGTKIILEDQSVIPQINVSDSSNQPVIMSVFTADKGTEDFIKISGQDFFKMYGSLPSFKRHGQPLLQAANAINNGAILYAKRVVDPTSKLANFAILGNVKKVEKQLERTKFDPSTGQPEVDQDGVIVKEQLFWKKDDVDNIENPADRPTYSQTDAGADAVPATMSVATINYTAEYIDDTFKGNAAKMADNFYSRHQNSETSFPLFLITDNGRGVSNKRVVIYPDTTLGRSAESARYVIDVYENNSRLESMVFSFNPSEVASGYNIFFDTVVKRNSSQIRCFGFEEAVDRFFAKVSEISAQPLETVVKSDIFNGNTFRGAPLAGVEIELENASGSTTVNLTSINGMNLVGGTNGDNFGDAPILNRGVGPKNDTVYAAEFEKAFNGSFDDEIYNYDNNPIDVIIDADYPDNVKKAITSFITFRQDVFYFRDIGVGYDTYQAIKNRLVDFSDEIQRSRFSATYCQDFKIIDPYTKKNINVTSAYPLSRLICAHWGNGRNLVLAGIANGWTVPEIVEGSVNYAPKHTPAEDQISELSELRVNYGYFQNNVFTYAAQYTAQDRYTQLSFINNVLLVQNLIKDIRTQCPKSRYKFITGDDFEKYEADIQNVIDEYASKFSAIKIEWQQDAVYAANKIVYAIIKVQFKDFVQHEIFRIIAVPVTDTL